MGTESVGVVSETSNAVPSRFLKPVVGNSIGRVAGPTLGQMATSAAANDPIDWFFLGAESLPPQASGGVFASAPAFGSEAASSVNGSASPEIRPLPAGQYRGEPAGTVQASAEELLAIDLALSDPMNSQLIEQLSPGNVSASSEFAQQLVERYGAQRFARMKQLQEAHERARDQFRDALNAVRMEPPSATIPSYHVDYVNRPPPLPANTPAGWTLVAVDRYESGGEGGSIYLGTEFQWRFDSAAFTRWYGQQPGISHQVFDEMYGRGVAEILPSPSAGAINEFSETPRALLELDDGDWLFDLQSGYMRPTASIAAVHSEEFELRDANAIRFDPQLGLSAAPSNFKESRDWFDGTFDLAVSAVSAYLAYQTGGAFAYSAQGWAGATGSAGYAIAAGAAAGATGAALNGIAQDRFDWKTLFRAALSGGLGAGIAQLPFGQTGDTLANLGYTELPSGGYNIDWASRVGSMAGQATLRGLLTDALGGRFRDGAKQAVLQFIAQEFSREFAQYIKLNNIKGADASALKFLSQVSASAIRVAGNTGNPMQPIAQNWLEGLLIDIGGSQPPPQLVAQVATVSPTLGGRAVDVSLDDAPTVEVRAGHAASFDVIGPASLAVQPAPTIPQQTPPPSFAGELDVWDPSHPEPTDEPLLVARYGRSDAIVGNPNGIIPIRELNRVPTPPLHPVTGLPVELVTTGSNLMPTLEWQPMRSQSEADIAALIAKQASADGSLGDLDQGRLDAANWVKLERARAAGATEGNGYVIDRYGNVRDFELNRSNQPLLKLGERVVTEYSYKAHDGQIVYVANRADIPSNIHAESILTGRAIYYENQRIARDFSVPTEYSRPVAEQRVTGGDPIESLRRQVSVSPAGPFGELARFIDRGSGQVNPLDWTSFKNRAMQIAETLGQHIQMVVTSNGMTNTYQQANANAVGLGRLIPNAIVVNVLNPSTGSEIIDTLEVVAAHLGVQQTVATAIAAQIREAREFQIEVADRVTEGGNPTMPQNVLLIAHSQGTVNANQALERVRSQGLVKLSEINAVYIGTAVDHVPIGLANMSNMTDAKDAVSNIWTDGRAAIRNTFSKFEPIPENYRQITTNFNSESRDIWMPEGHAGASLPTGNNHSMYLYLARPEVQQDLARLIGVSILNPSNRPVIPTYTGEPETRTGG